MADECTVLKAHLRLLEKYAKNLILDDPESNYEIGWNAAVRDVLNEIESWKDDQGKVNETPKRGIIRN